jgi:crossover junction endodeoxyribonuclease RuvC
VPPAPAAGPLRILGLDPGTRVVGWGVIAAEAGRPRVLAYGALRAPARATVPERLASLAGALRDVVERLRPTEAAIEEVFFGRDVRAAVRIGEGRGAALVVLATAGVPTTGYTNNVVKRAVTGAGRAPKERVQTMVGRLLGLSPPPSPFDAADALALALCHFQRRGHDERCAPARPAGRGRDARIPPRLAAAIAAARAAGR